MTKIRCCFFNQDIWVQRVHAYHFQIKSQPKRICASFAKHEKKPYFCTKVPGVEG